MTQLPIKYRVATNVVGQATIDDEIKFLSQYQWYVSDTRTKRPPKTTIRVDGKAKTVLLNRLCWMMMHADPIDQQKWLNNPEILWSALSRLGRVKVRGGEDSVWDCRIVNLDWSQPHKVSYVLPATAIPQASEINVVHDERKQPVDLIIPQPPLSHSPSSVSAMDLLEGGEASD